MDMVEIKAKEAIEPAWLQDFLQRHHSARVASRGRLHYPASLPRFVAFVDGLPSALLTYCLDHGGCEIVTLHSDAEGRGAGRSLIEQAAEAARQSGCSRLWLVTTNDNTQALRFYQRRGFSITALHVGAVDEARRSLKPEIPPLGNDGICIRDEIELELHLEP